MFIALLVILTALLIAATAYVHYRLPIHTQDSGKTWMLRFLLILVGAGLGWLSMMWFSNVTEAARSILFLFGFGLAHLPSFVILYVKRQRGEYGHG